MCIARENCENRMKKKKSKKRAKKTAYMHMCVNMLSAHMFKCCCMYFDLFTLIFIRRHQDWIISSNMACFVVFPMHLHKPNDSIFQMGWLGHTISVESEIFFLNTFWIDWFIQIRVYLASLVREIYKFCSITISLLNKSFEGCSYNFES